MDITITRTDDSPFVGITGTFYRSVDSLHVDGLLSGSTQHGRYSEIDQKTLYLSASKEGVAAALIAHTHNTTSEKSVIELHVKAENIFDLRDTDACETLGINPNDALGPWQETVQRGDISASQTLANHLRKIGATGLIDPSRKAPGLWHLVLFNWNNKGHPIVTVASTLPTAKTLL